MLQLRLELEKSAELLRRERTSRRRRALPVTPSPSQVIKNSKSH